MSWGELLRSETKDGNDELADRDQDQDILYLSAERRNVNGRYPIGREIVGSYRKLTKRYPIAKRSLRPINDETRRLKTTDPKVRS